MKCRYSHCKHGGEVKIEDAVKVGKNTYWHPDCLAEKNAMAEIIDVWVKRIDEHPIFSLLRKTVDDLVYKEGNDAECLLFSLNYCIDHGWNLRYPSGLRYVAKNGDAKQEWERSIKEKQAIEMRQRQKADREENRREENISSSFTYKPQKARGFDDILKEK